MKLEWYPYPATAPVNDDKCLITCRNKKGIANVNMAYYDGKFWHGMGSFAEVVAWCPLPEPAKIGGEDGKTD